MNDDVAMRNCPMRNPLVAKSQSRLLQLFWGEDVKWQGIAPVVFQSKKTFVLEDGDLVQENPPRLRRQARYDLLNCRLSVLQHPGAEQHVAGCRLFGMLEEFQRLHLRRQTTSAFLHHGRHIDDLPCQVGGQVEHRAKGVELDANM